MSGRAARRVRVVHQFTQSECGICCSAMILSAYGVQNCVAELRRAHETGRDGLGLNDVAALLRGRGMQVRSYRAAPLALRKLNGPFIAYWDDSHLVVVERIGADRVEIVDPGIGRKTIDADEFAARYSGVVIHAVPEEGWAPARSTERNVWGVFLRQASDVRRPLVYAGLLSLLLYVGVLGVPLATQYAVNGYDDLVRDSPILLMAVIFLVPMLAYYAVSSFRNVLIARIVSSLGSAMMSTTFGTLMRLPFKYFASRSSGELMYRMASVTAVRDAISGQITMVALDIGTLLAVFTYLFVRSASLGGVAAALFAAMVLIAVVGYRPSRAVVEEEIAETTRASSMQLEALASIETLKVTGMTDRFVDEWRKVYARVMHHMARRIIIQGRITSATTALQTFGPFIVLLAGLALVRDGELDLGSVVAAQALTATALGTVLSLSSVFSQFVLANAQVERLGDIVNQPDSELVFGRDRVELDGSVAVTGLGFTYPGARKPTLTGIDFSARPGQRIAIVGSSGSGKSTLAKLLLGLYPAGAGSISYSGRRLAEMTPESLYDAVGNVPQDVVLSNRTIAENIDFTGGAPDLPLVRAVVEIAALGPDVEAMPLGLHTQVRDLGGSLSGGQRQRVALARALAREPRILVLDEATSSLDAITEEAISSVLRDMRCTQIVIAHRLSTIVSADQILVLERGRVVQRGTHRELLGEPGVYRSLVQSQLNVVG